MKKPSLFFSGILLFLILFSSNQNYALGDIYTVYPYEDIECFNNSSNYDFWDLLTFEEDSPLQVGTNLNNLYNSETGTVIKPFEGNAQYNLNLQLLSELPNGKYPDGEPTNCIPIGSEWFLVIGLLCFILARLVKVFLLKSQNQ